MDRVSVELAWSGRTVAFEGSLALYERWIAPLVAGLYAREPGSEPARPVPAPVVAPHAAEAPAGRAPQSGPSAFAPDATSPAQQPPRQIFSPGPPAAPPRFKPQSPAQFQSFAAQVGDRAATPDKRIMAFAFYIWNYEKDEDGFTRADAESFFRTILEEPPPDMEALLAELAGERGFLETQGKRWAISKKGVGFVKARLLGQF